MHRPHKSVNWNYTHCFVKNLARASCNTKFPLCPVASCQLRQKGTRRKTATLCQSQYLLAQIRSTLSLLQQYSTSVQNTITRWTILQILPRFFLNDQSATTTAILRSIDQSTVILQSSLTLQTYKRLLCSASFSVFCAILEPYLEPATTCTNMRLDAYVSYTKLRYDTQLCSTIRKLQLPQSSSRNTTPVPLSSKQSPPRVSIRVPSP